MPKFFSRRKFLWGGAAGAALAGIGVGVNAYRRRQLAALPPEKKAELLLIGKSVPGARILENQASALKQELTGIMRSDRLVVVSTEGSRRASIEQLMRADAANRITEFIGHAVVAEINQLPHLVILDLTKASEKSVSSAVDALDNLRNETASEAHFKELTNFLDYPDHSEARGGAAVQFAKNLLDDLQSGGGLAKVVSGSQAADWISATFLDRSSIRLGHELKKFPGLGANPPLIHFHPNYLGPSVQDLKISSDEKLVGLVVSNEGRASRAYVYRNGKEVSTHFGKFYNSPIKAAGKTTAGKWWVPDKKNASQVGSMGFYGSPSEVQAGPKEAFFFHENKWKKTGVTSRGIASRAELPEPMSLEDARKLRHVVIDELGYIHDTTRVEEQIR